MNKKRFEESLARWNSFIESVDLEACSHMHHVCVFDLPENLGRIAMVSCPPELDKAVTPSRCAQDFDTNFVWPEERHSCSRSLVHVLDRGSLNAGTLVGQVFHRFYVGSMWGILVLPRTNYVMHLLQGQAASMPYCRLRSCTLGSLRACSMRMELALCCLVALTEVQMKPP